MRGKRGQARERSDALAQVRARFVPASLRLVLAAVLDRDTLVELLGRFGPAEPAALAAWARDELAGRLVALAFDRDEVGHAVTEALDQATRGERSLIQSIGEAEMKERFAELPALRWRRHGARLIWALARDARTEVAGAARQAIRAWAEQAERLERARAAVQNKGAAAELAEFEAVYRDAAERVLHLEEEFSAVERERARLLAEIGQREAQLREEARERRALGEQLAALKGLHRPEVAPPATARPGTGQLARLEKRLASTERELEALRDKAAAATELEREIARLRQTIAHLREERARERSRPPAPTPARAEATLPGAPLVEPPPSRKRKGPVADPRVGVFVDVANLAGAARLLCDAAVDYRRLLHLAQGGRRLADARAFAIDKGTAGYEAFATALRDAGYRVFTKRPQVFDDGTVKADWDVGMTVEILGAADKLDVVALCSGDGDFVPVVNALKARGVRVEVFAFAERAAVELKRCADLFAPLDDAVLERR